MSLKKTLPLSIFFVSSLILYYTSYPSIGWWDSSEYIVLSDNLTIPVPGGSILYIILGRIFITLFFFLPTAKAVILVSIFSVSAGSVFLYYSISDLIQKYFPDSDELLKYFSSFSTALSIPFLYSIWQQAHVTRVYSLGLFFTGLLVFLTIRILCTSDVRKIKYFLLLLFALTIDFSAHRLNTPFWPIVFLLLLIPMRKHLFNIRFIAASILMIIIAFSIHLYIPIRSIHDPLLNMGVVTDFSSFISWLRMDRYSNESNFAMIFDRKAPFWDYQINFMYIRYFLWNFWEKGSTMLPGVLLLAGFTGFLYQFKNKLKFWIFPFSIFFIFSFVLIVYLNIYENFHLMERELDRLYLPSFMIFTLYIGLGLFVISRLLVNFAEKIKPGKQKYYTPIFVLSLILLPGNTIVSNWKSCNMNRFTFAEDFAYNILESCEENAVLFVNGDNDTLPLWYLQFVENIRTDVCVINLSLLNIKDQLEQFTRKPFLLELENELLEKDRITPLRLHEPLKVAIPVISDLYSGDSLKFECGERQFGESRGLIPQDIVLLSFLRNNAFKRPVHFSLTVPSVSRLVNEEMLTLSGVTFKLTPNQLEPDYNFIEDLLINKFRFRSFNDHEILLSGPTATLFSNFAYLYLHVINYYFENGNIDKAKELLTVFENKLPAWRFSDRIRERIEIVKDKLNNS